mmetsp:Transcript_53987/g.156836  ORF Transcript_53987/g.156836 Transcript_53987/m.156836 type:complete len:253 (-) Transcript_53987:2-760(-)
MPTDDMVGTTEEVLLVVTPPEEQLHAVEEHEDDIVGQERGRMVLVHQRKRHRHHIDEDDHGDERGEGRAIDESQALGPRGRLVAIHDLVAELVDLQHHGLAQLAEPDDVLFQRVLALRPIVQNLLILLLLLSFLFLCSHEVGPEALQLPLQLRMLRGCRLDGDLCGNPLGVAVLAELVLTRFLRLHAQVSNVIGIKLPAASLHVTGAPPTSLAAGAFSGGYSPTPTLLCATRRTPMAAGGGREHGRIKRRRA